MVSTNICLFGFGSYSNCEYKPLDNSFVFCRERLQTPLHRIGNDVVLRETVRVLLVSGWDVFFTDLHFKMYIIFGTHAKTSFPYKTKFSKKGDSGFEFNITFSCPFTLSDVLLNVCSKSVM